MATDGLNNTGLNILITGADGFVGRTLTKILLEENVLPIKKLRLLDRAFKSKYQDVRLQTFTGDFFDSAMLRQGLFHGIDVVFHLASIPGGAAERDYNLGKRVNLDGTILLFEALREQTERTKKIPVVVFASTIAVYGSPLPEIVDANTSPNPNLSYGTQKLVAELLLQDYSRKKFFDGRAVRLPGIVARPQEPSGLISAFMSDIMHSLARGEKFNCPVSADAWMWWMSAKCCARNLIHAATMPAPQNRIALLPALRASMGEIVDGLAELFGQDRLALVNYQKDEQVQKAFGSFPIQDSAVAEVMGFKHDGTVLNLIRNSLNLNTNTKEGG